MIFKDQYDISLWHKSVFCCCVLITVLATLWLMFADLAHSDTWLNQYQIAGNLLRRVLIASCLIIYFLRLQITVWIFQKRKWTWLETITISILVPFALYAFANVGGNNKQVIGIVELIGVLLYLLGSYINTHSEYSRYIWKFKEENRGRLYTDELFSMSMHINYFGDIILFTGFATITHSLIMFVIPLIMTVNFIFNIIPSLDRYLEKNYGEEFRDYCHKTKKLIPWIY
jgi:protein-S-isoprenylcysteine O-methyltransferase Ste14